MFLQVSVVLFTVGGDTPLGRYIPSRYTSSGRYTPSPNPRQVHLPGQVHPPGRYTPGRYTPSRYIPPGIPPRQVHPPEQVHPPGPWAGTPQAGTLPQVGTPPAQCMLGYSQQAGSMHPTGMQSCSLIQIHFKRGN